jgi:hypothetical protein
VFAAIDETNRRPVVVDRTGLVVHEAVREPDLLDDLEGEVALELRRLLRVGDPEAARGIEAVPESREAALEVAALGCEEDDDPGSRLRA